jgi:NAD(P)-dependent dehydrogenase (short-subunit alcohol dehydrogenase family)
VLIAGGTPGVGFGAAEIYARRGCDVIILSQWRGSSRQLRRR